MGKENEPEKPISEEEAKRIKEELDSLRDLSNLIGANDHQDLEKKGSEKNRF